MSPTDTPLPPTTQPVPTAPRATTWQHTPPPGDRCIVITGNITTEQGDGRYEVTPISTRAQWSYRYGHWLDAEGYSILHLPSREALTIRAWIDLPGEEVPA